MPTMICKCGVRVDTPPDQFDPPGTAEIHGIPCPACDDGDRHEPRFRDAHGNWLSPVDPHAAK